MPKPRHDTTPNIKPSPRACTCHRDGTVSYWHVWDQQWVREPASQVSDRVLATLCDSERTRILRHADDAR